MIDKIVEVKVETKLKASYMVNAAPHVDPRARDWSDGKMAHDLGCKLADYITSKDPGTEFLICNEGDSVRLEDHDTTEVKTRTISVTELDDPLREKFVVAKKEVDQLRIPATWGTYYPHDAKHNPPTKNGEYICWCNYDDYTYMYRKFAISVFNAGRWSVEEDSRRKVEVLAWFELPTMW